MAERRADDPAPDDPFRGLYLTDDAVDRLLQDTAAEAVTVQTTQLASLDAEADRTRTIRRATSGSAGWPGRPT